MNDRRSLTNVAASVRTRLLNHSRARNEDFNHLLTRFGAERMLYRLTQTEHANAFVLKGAMLFALWTDLRHRATRDVDLLALGPSDLERMATIFRRACLVHVHDDGVRFDPDTVTATPLRADEEYHGVRVNLRGLLGTARIDLQVDVGFGDTIIPAPVLVDFPALLGQPAPRIATYPRETVVAEKLHAMVTRGMANSRMKDFFDIQFLARQFSFDGPTLARAIRATFDRRRVPLPGALPTAFTDEFMDDVAKRTQWKAFLRRSGLPGELDLRAVVSDVARFCWPAIEAARDDRAIGAWSPNGNWS